MKSSLVVAGFCAVTLVAALSAIAFTHPNPDLRRTSADAEQDFDVTGRVVQLDKAASTVRIAHDAIPGYMPAMTMPFQVREKSLLRHLTPGDAVRFRLVVTKDDSWISRIQPLPAIGLQASPAANPTAGPGAGDADRLELGERVPDIRLLDQNGQPVSLSQFRGKAVLLTFIYTRCPIPNFCPLMSKNFAALEVRLAKRFPNQFHLLSISIDPTFDRPEVLQSYAARFDADLGDWTFATGTTEQIDAVAALFGLTHEPENGLIAHDLCTALISPEGKLVYVWKSNVWTPLEVERRVQETLGTPRG